MISTVTYTGDGATRVFPVAFEIQGENYVVVFIDDVAVNDRTTYDIINNSIVFVEDSAPTTDSIIEIVVASSPTEIADLNAPPSTVQTIIDNLADINSVATTVVPNIAEILLADDNATIATTQASISTAQAVIATSKASEASISAGNALTSENNADTSEANALSYKNSAEASATTATIQAGIATTKASEAGVSASNALASETQAGIYASQIDPTKIVAKDSPTGSAMMPAGTTAQRPISPSNGYMRYNTDLLKFEGYQGGVWGTLGGLDINTLTSKATPIGADEMVLADSTSSFSLKKVTWANLKATLPSAPAVRQTVLSGAVDVNGFSAFGGSTGSTTVAASSTLVATCADGNNNRIGTIVNPLWTGLSTNGTMYLYLDIATDGTCTNGSTTLVPTYRWGGVDVITNLQNTFNIQEMKMKVGNGTVATQVYRVFVGEVVVSGGVVSTITWYALMGRYDSGYTTPLPSASTQTSKNHNIGTTTLAPQNNIILECVTADAGYVAGDILTNVGTQMAGGFTYPMPSTWTRNTIGFSLGSAGAFISMNKTGGLATVLTTGSWKYKIVAQRGW